jgi:hypothetical protein
MPMKTNLRGLLPVALLLAAGTARAQAGAPPAADTARLPLTYCVALPRPDFAHWDADYGQYGRFLTPDIRRTQLGLGFAKGGISYWYCQPAASPHAQLDTLTRVADPQQLQGRWRSLLVRTVVFRDSAVLGEKRIYRTVRLRPSPPQTTELTLADGRLTLLAAPGGGAPFTRLGRKKYALVSGRYLLVYGLLKSGGAVSQVGLDAQGRLVLHNCAVAERKVPGQYQTYETVLNQAVFEPLRP